MQSLRAQRSNLLKLEDYLISFPMTWEAAQTEFEAKDFSGVYE